LVAWEQQKGRGVQMVTTQWITTNYAGVDLAQRIRSFLRDKYSATDWGIEYVLLVGHYGDLPMRVVWQDLGYGYPQTDTYYAELSLPDNQSWDTDGDGRYAEDEDEIDFYTEVAVGRIPWSEPAIVQHICQKSVLFEQNDDPSYKQNILFLGSLIWPDTDDAVLMETIAALPHMADWTDVRMYEEGYSAYPMDFDLTRTNVVSEWSSGKYAVVDWGGHGSPTSAHRYYPDMPAFIRSADCAVIGDDYPSIVFATSCYTSSPYHASLGREMLYQGAVGYVGATQVAGGRKGWEVPADGSSQTLNYLFTGYVTSGDYTQGEALQLALRETYLQGAWRWPKYEVLEWGALYGNPDLGVRALPAVRIQFPDGLPERIAPGAETSIAVRIDPVEDTLVAGSAALHYRLDGGAFQAVPLNPLGDDDYEAVLPPTSCDHVPEFYVSALGAVSGMVTQPANAPAEVFDTEVGTFAIVFHDDFEQMTGWMIDWLGATDGQWDRDVPVNDPNWAYDPLSDADGSGKCALTANRPGNSDVDGGGVRLYSPLLDMTAEGITLRYRFYLYAEDQTEPDYLLVEISSNGMNGPWREVVRHIRNNGLSWRIDSFTAAELQALGIPLTDQMHVRYTAYDGGSDHVVEAGLDAFEVLSFGCVTAQIVGPVTAAEDWNSTTMALISSSTCTPDQCPNTSTCTDGICYFTYNRYLYFHPNNAGQSVALRVRHVASGETRWVSPDVQQVVHNNSAPSLLTYMFTLPDGSPPDYAVWPEEPIAVTGCFITPGEEYEIQAILDGCDPANEACYTAALSLPTAIFGDAVATLTPPGPDAFAYPPQGPLVDVTDMTAVVEGFSNANWTSKLHCDLIGLADDPSFNNVIVDVSDLTSVVDAFGGGAYPGTSPQDCP
jgi:hypothetical protein